MHTMRKNKDDELSEFRFVVKPGRKFGYIESPFKTINQTDGVDAK